MESFSIVKRGYNPQEVDEYIETLEQVIKSYKDKDNAIKNAIISAQVAADNILKNTHLESAEYKNRTIAQLRGVQDSIETQRSRLQSFQEDYNDLMNKYMKPFEHSDVAVVYERIEDLEKCLRDINSTLQDDVHSEEQNPDTEGEVEE